MISKKDIKMNMTVKELYNFSKKVDVECYKHKKCTDCVYNGANSHCQALIDFYEFIREIYTEDEEENNNESN